MKKFKGAYYKIITDQGTTIIRNDLFTVMKHQEHFCLNQASPNKNISILLGAT